MEKNATFPKFFSKRREKKKKQEQENIKSDSLPEPCFKDHLPGTEKSSPAGAGGGLAKKSKSLRRSPRSPISPPTTSSPTNSPPSSPPSLPLPQSPRSHSSSSPTSPEISFISSKSSSLRSSAVSPPASVSRQSSMSPPTPKTKKLKRNSFLFKGYKSPLSSQSLKDKETQKFTGDLGIDDDEDDLFFNPFSAKRFQSPRNHTSPTLQPFGSSSSSSFSLSPKSNTYSHGFTTSSASPLNSFRCEEHLFGKTDYEQIIESLLQMSLEQKEFFFIGFEKVQIDSIQLLRKMEQMIDEEVSNSKKEDIVEILQIWNKIFGKYYRSFYPSLTREMNLLIDSLEVPFSHILAWKGTNLMKCGTVLQVAQSLTSIMFQSYQNIQYSEFHDGAWEKEERYQKAPNVMKMIGNFNRLSEIVVESILSCEEAARRPTLIFSIKLAKRFWKMRNFEGVAAVVSGLNQASIRRLKPLWVDLNSKYKRTFELLDQFLFPEFNFREYRNVLSLTEPPLLPWLSPKLRELRFLYDGNQTTFQNGCLNLPHLAEIGFSIRSYLRYQKCDYELDPAIDKTVLLQLLKDRSVSEEVCYQKSIELFPLRPPHTSPKPNSPQNSFSPPTTPRPLSLMIKF